jgi:catechol 2,3-dioxygenase-like lactoylglutathione lyase family enzyme
MHGPRLAPHFCQVAWVVKDLAKAEAFFTQLMGVKQFVHVDSLAQDNEGTYLGQPGDWVIRIALAYASDTQIELIQPLSGNSIFADDLARQGDAVQHVAYWIDESEYEAAAHHLAASGYPLIQGFKGRIDRVGYFDTRAAIGVVTEIIGSTPAGHEIRRNLKAGKV